MANVEIDETELANFRALSGTVAKMMESPTARRKVLEARKIIDPNAVIPELDAATPVLAEVGELKKQMSEFMSKYDERETKRTEESRSDKLRADWEKGRGKLRDMGYQTDGIEAIEKIMEAKGVADHEIAEAYWRKMNPPAEPAVSSGNRFDFLAPPAQDDKAMQALMNGDDETFLRMVVPDAIRAGRN